MRRSGLGSHRARLGFVQSCCHPRSADAPAHGLSQDRVPRVAFLGFRELAKAELSSEQYRLYSTRLFLWFLTSKTWNFRFQLESNKIMIAFRFRQQPRGCSAPTDEFQGGAGLELLLLNLTLAEAKARSSLLTHGISPQESLIFWGRRRKVRSCGFYLWGSQICL